MDVYKTDHTGKKLFHTCVEHNISGYPVLQPLVGNNDQQCNDGIQHIFLQSAAGRDPRRANCGAGLLLL